jgi:hypothetical protein
VVRNVNVLASGIRRAFFLVLWTIVLLVVPYNIYGANSRFDIYSVLFETRYDSAISKLTIQFIPQPSYLLPSLLICIPCFLWLYKQGDMDIPKLLGSTGIVFIVLTMILLWFLPIWAVLPWFFNIVPAYVPNFIDLIPFSGLVFTVMVLLPLLWRILVYTKTQETTLGKKVAGAVLSVSVLLFPMTLEIFSWRSTNFNQNFFEGYSFYSATWSMHRNVDGNLWGQNSWFSFHVSSIYTSPSLIIQILPSVIFSWFICRSPIGKKGNKQVLAAGFAQLFIVTGTCVWSNYLGSHPGSWIVLPFPILLIIGFTIVAVNQIYQWKKKIQSKETHRVSNEEISTQMMSRSS